MKSMAQLLVGDEIPATLAIREVATQGPLVAITGRMLLRLADELGSNQATWKWIVRLATEIQRPIAVNDDVSDAATSTTYLIGPAGWSDERVQGWAGGLRDELAAAFGPMTMRVEEARQQRRAREREERKGGRTIE